MSTVFDKNPPGTASSALLSCPEQMLCDVRIRLFVCKNVCQGSSQVQGLAPPALFSYTVHQIKFGVYPVVHKKTEFSHSRVIPV